jgi:hypothetical protein
VADWVRAAPSPFLKKAPYNSHFCPKQAACICKKHAQKIKSLYVDQLVVNGLSANFWPVCQGLPVIGRL